MSFPQRLFIFCIGIGLGGLLSLYIIRNRGGLSEREGPPETLAQAEAEAVPSIEKAYEERGEPLKGPFIVGEFTEPRSDDGTYRRVYVLEGRQPGQLLRVEEIQSAAPTGQLKVESWRIMAANRVVVKLVPGTSPSTLREPLAQLGYRLLRKSDGPDTYVIDLGDHQPQTVDEALESIQGIGAPVVEVLPDYLDKPVEQP